MNATPSTLALLVRKAAERKVAVTQDVRVIAYTTRTGDATAAQKLAAQCAREGHTMTETIADLPGDRSVGYCECGEYLDTGTWDERNA